MAFNKNIKEALNKAQERAALEVQSWVPQNEGDNTGGVVIERGVMEVPILGVVPVVVHATEEGQYFRVSWGGAVLRNKYTSLDPQPGEYVWYHFHGERLPKEEKYGAYQLIEVVVLDSDGNPKVPANTLPAHENSVVMDVDAPPFDVETGEVQN